MASVTPLQSKLGTATDTVGQLRLYLFYIFEISGYRFLSTKFDVGASILLEENFIASNNNKVNREMKTFFDKHPVYSQRIITCILRAGMAEVDELSRASNPADSDSGSDSDSDSDSDYHSRGH